MIALVPVQELALALVQELVPVPVLVPVQELAQVQQPGRCKAPSSKC